MKVKSRPAGTKQWPEQWLHTQHNTRLWNTW